jgi:hypothetical protein
MTFRQPEETEGCPFLKNFLRSERLGSKYLQKYRE